MRVEFVNIVESSSDNEKIRSSGYRFAWIYDFPLFTYNNETNSLETTHHPFTQPHPEDMKYLTTDSSKVYLYKICIIMAITNTCTASLSSKMNRCEVYSTI